MEPSLSEIHKSGSGLPYRNQKGLGFRVFKIGSLLQQPAHKKFKLSKIELIYKAKKFKVPPFTI